MTNTFGQVLFLGYADKHAQLAPPVTDNAKDISPPRIAVFPIFSWLDF
jgi:hypothetical protein